MATSTILRSLAEDAVFLKEAIIGARATGDLTTAEAQRAITAASCIVQTIAEATGLRAAQPGVTATDEPLSEFFRWPNSTMRCPKCGASKARFTDYVRPSKIDVEKIKHVCRCGYFIYTKPLDASPGADDSWPDDADDRWTSDARQEVR